MGRHFAMTVWPGRNIKISPSTIKPAGRFIICPSRRVHCKLTQGDNGECSGI